MFAVVAARRTVAPITHCHQQQLLATRHHGQRRLIDDRCIIGTTRVYRRRCCASPSSSSSSSSNASSPTASSKATSFFDEVDEVMKRDAPMQYEKFVASRTAFYESFHRRFEEVDKRFTHRGGSDERRMNTDRSSTSTTSGYEYKIQQKMGSAASAMSMTDDSSGYKSMTALKNPVLLNNTIAPARESTTKTMTNDEIPSNAKKSSGVFSTISKETLLSNSGSTSIAGGILMSDLFPTLYGTKNAQQQEDTLSLTIRKQRATTIIDPAMIYHRDHYETYEQAMNAVLDEVGTTKAMSKFGKNEGGQSTVDTVKQWLLSNTRIVNAHLVRERWVKVEGAWTDEKWMTVATESNDNSDKEDGIDDSTFKLELGLQREVFLSKLQTSLEQRNERNDHTANPGVSGLDRPYADDVHSVVSEEIVVDPIKFYEVTQFIIGALSRYCARRARSSPMVVTWSKIKESGILLPKDVVATMLYVCGTMGMADSIGVMSSSSSSDGTLDEKFLVPEEVATYHDLSSKPTEASISLRIKSLVTKGDASGAEKMLEAFKKLIKVDESSSGELVRLRTYLPILKKYCEIGDLDSALSLFKRMQTTPGVILEPETYVLLLASMAENGYFRHDSPPIDGATDLGYTNPRGPGLFGEIVTEMAAEVLEISSSSARRLYNSLAAGFQSDCLGNDGHSIVSILKEAHPLMSMSLTRRLAERNELVASRISLDRSTGLCPVTQAQQRLIILEPDQRIQLHSDLLKLSTEQFAKFAGRKADDSPTRAQEQLQLFSNWLDQRQGEPFTAIVDGANVGYYMQSFDRGRFNYYQIQFMVDTLKGRGENPLVVIPNKYGQQKFYSTKGEYQKLDQSEMEIMQTLTNTGKLYKVPPRCLDDFYWMVASVSDQNASRNGRDISVSNTDLDSRFPGARPMLITNDHMRDHRLELLEPRLFRRWYGCHIVNYNFTAFVAGESVAGNEIGFSQADFFSREIQGNPCPGNSPDDGVNMQWSGCAWHFPVTDWELDERFVVRIPVKEVKTNKAR